MHGDGNLLLAKEAFLESFIVARLHYAGDGWGFPAYSPQPPLTHLIGVEIARRADEFWRSQKLLGMSVRKQSTIILLTHKGVTGAVSGTVYGHIARH